MKDDLKLGRLLGRHEALSAVAARCSAADAAQLRDIRDKKLYEGHSTGWEEFCSQHLHMSKTNANRIIRQLEEFGPQYFEVAQITRISPETYRAIAPSIREGALHTEGEAIALIPENANKIAAAVTAVRQKEAKPAPVAPVDPFRVALGHGEELVAELSGLAATRVEDRPRISNIVGLLRLQLERFQRTL